MDYRIKLRRSWNGHDGWDAYVEEVGIADDGSIGYRRSSDGNCDIGEFSTPWEGEEKALTFMLGFVPSKVLADRVRKEVTALPTLEPLENNTDSWRGSTNVNYGTY